VPHFISWADSERDLSAWRGNAMQTNALEEVFRLESAVKERLAVAEPRAGAEAAEARRLLEDWRRLTTSDHFYYMCTRYFADGGVHAYFNPYESPYDSYINFMNVLDHLRTRAAAGRAVQPA
jgi:alpha-amylase